MLRVVGKYTHFMVNRWCMAADLRTEYRFLPHTLVMGPTLLPVMIEPAASCARLNLFIAAPEKARRIRRSQ